MSIALNNNTTDYSEVEIIIQHGNTTKLTRLDKLF